MCRKKLQRVLKVIQGFTFFGVLLAPFSSDKGRKLGKDKSQNASISGLRGKAIVFGDDEPLFCMFVNLYISPLEGGYLEDPWLVHVIH